MKRSVIIIAAFCIVQLLNAQSNAIDDIFNKYSEREGFTVVNISGKMFSLLAGNGEKKDGTEILNSLKSIRILSVEDSLLSKNINFYNELNSKVNLNSYEELMSVKESRDVTRILVKQNGNIITELLMVTGGPGGNTLISIRGDLNLKSISELSKSTGIEELKDLDEVDSKNP